MEYGGKQSKDLGLSPAVYCKSTDEHHSNTHWSDWSCNEPPQELRWFEKSTREPYREPGFVQARGTPNRQFLRNQFVRFICEQADFR